MSLLNLASIRTCTETEGPGKRFAIWVQGCPRRCFGCCNPEMQEIRQNIVVDTADLVKLIALAKEKYQIEGVSFIGGEPFLQAEGCSDVSKWCRQNGLSTLAFSGYLYAELTEMRNTYVDAFLECLDVLVDGPFMIDHYDNERDWIGSTNQRVWYLTNRYDSTIEKNSTSHQAELLISDSKIFFNGWPFDQ